MRRVISMLFCFRCSILCLSGWCILIAILKAFSTSRGCNATADSNDMFVNPRIAHVLSHFDNLKSSSKSYISKKIVFATHLNKNILANLKCHYKNKIKLLLVNIFCGNLNINDKLQILSLSFQEETIVFNFF